MSEWKEVAFSEFVDINPKVVMSRDKEYFYVEMKDMNPNSKFSYPSRKRILKGGSRFIQGDTLFARISPCLEQGNINQINGLANENGWGSTEFLVFRAIKGISDKDFVTYLSKSDSVKRFAENRLEGSSGRQRVSKDAFENLKLQLPDLIEQRAIAEVLSSLDDKIDLLHRQNQTLEQMAETLYDAWFEELEFTSRVSDLIELQNGYAFKSKSFQDFGEDRVLKIKNISGGIVDIETTDFVSHETVENLDEKFSISTGDILFAMTGAKIGKMGIIPKTDYKLWLNQRVGLFKEKYYGSRFLAYLHLKSDYGKDYIENTATGSAQPNISGTGIENCGFPEITEQEIIDYSNQLAPLYEKVIFNLGQIQKLESLRNTLLPKLMSGEIRIDTNE